MGEHDTTSARGRRAEERAAQHLEARGLHVVGRNFRCRGGEIDLVCRDGATLVFVEVRLRSDPRFGGAAASVTVAKQGRIALAAQHYLAAHRLHDAPCRFDCVLIDGETPPEWLRDAFQAA